MRKIAAPYIFPVSAPPIKYGIIYLNNNSEIIEIKDNKGVMIEEEGCEYYNGAIIPGLVNAHTHLELSHLKGFFEHNSGMLNFIEKMMNKPDFTGQQINSAMEKADRFIYSQGVSLVANICNTDISIKVMQKSKILYKPFVELFGLNSDFSTQIFENGEKIVKTFKQHGFDASITLHTPYSVTPQLVEKIANSEYSNTLSIHTLENSVESEKLTDDKQSFRSFFIEKGKINDKMYYQQHHPYNFVLDKFKNRNVLLVHNTFAKEEDWNIALQIAQTNNLNLYAVTCPRSNMLINNVLPNYEQWNKNIPICIGTDSLCSNFDLSVFEEMKFLIENSKFTFNEILTMATINGARALGFDNIFGTIEKGKKPGINLIENFDFKEMKPVLSSTIRRLV